MRVWLLAFVAATALILVGCGGDDCTPECEGRVCGDDGCGGTCGTCEEGTVCGGAECIACEPDCSGKMCGPDGCGGQCGACTEAQVCDPDSYLCIAEPTDCDPVCDDYGYSCGPNGCGGDCGECEPGTFCDPDLHFCAEPCEPNCDLRVCGDDGCGGSCGECSPDEICEGGQCVAGGTLPDDDFRVVFGYKGRVPGFNDNEFDLHIIRSDGMNPMNPEVEGSQALTEFALDNATDCQTILAEDEEGNVLEYGPCSCQFGCLVDDRLEWIAVSLKRPTQEGFTFQIGRFNTEKKVAMVKGVKMEDVIDFKFGGDYLYYSKVHTCMGKNCQYTIYRQPLNPVGPSEELFVFPPEGDPDWPDHSNYKGHFKVSRDGQVLALLGTTIRSVRIYMWRDGTLAELDYICSLMQGGACIGAGSEYTDTDPVAISPDSSKILTFFVAERDLRVRIYDTLSYAKKSLTLFSAASGTYLADVCPTLRQIPWSFKQVEGDPVFSPDGSSVYFLATNDCDNPTGQEKNHTNILMLDVGSIGDGSPFEESDFVNVTRNPKDPSPDNVVISGFDLSPSGRTLALTGTPMFSQGDLLTEESDRARRDKEIWLIGTSGAGMTQLTDELKFMAMNPRALDSSVTDYYNN